MVPSSPAPVQLPEAETSHVVEVAKKWCHLPPGSPGHPGATDSAKTTSITIPNPKSTSRPIWSISAGWSLAHQVLFIRSYELIFGITPGSPWHHCTGKSAAFSYRSGRSSKHAPQGGRTNAAGAKGGLHLNTLKAQSAFRCLRSCGIYFGRLHKLWDTPPLDHSSALYFALFFRHATRPVLNVASCCFHINWVVFPQIRSWKLRPYHTGIISQSPTLCVGISGYPPWGCTQCGHVKQRRDDCRWSTGDQFGWTLGEKLNLLPIWVQIYPGYTTFM